MRVDYVKETIQIPYKDQYGIEREITIFSSEIVEVREFNFNFLSITLPIVCLESKKRIFFYSEERAFSQIILLFKDKREEVRRLMLNNYSKSGVLRDFISCIFTEMCREYGMLGYSYISNVHGPYRAIEEGVSAYELNNIYSNYSVSPIKADVGIYQTLIDMKPENVVKRTKELQEKQEKERRELQEKQEKERIEKFKKAEEKKKVDAEIQIKNILKKYDVESELLELSLANNAENSAKEYQRIITQIRREKEKVERYWSQGYIDANMREKTYSVLKDAYDIAEKQCSRKIEEYLNSEYGPIDFCKDKLKNSINKLTFPELQELLRKYKEHVSKLKDRLRDFSAGTIDLYGQYIELYENGIILIKNRLNQLNRNKQKTKFLPKADIDTAMMFFYDTTNPEAAYETQRKEQYSQNKESGDIGEKKVEFALRWLDSSYKVIQPQSKDFSGKPCIKIRNPEFIDISQEYDHIIVGKNGVLLVETKNYKGKLTIDKNGNWIRNVNGKEYGITNPLQQVRQHEKMLISILPSDVKVTSILCIANSSAIIDGVENTSLPIVKSDMLVEYIEHVQEIGTPLSKEKIEKCVELINSHMEK